MDTTLLPFIGAAFSFAMIINFTSLPPMAVFFICWFCVELHPKSTKSPYKQVL